MDSIVVIIIIILITLSPSPSLFTTTNRTPQKLNTKMETLCCVDDANDMLFLCMRARYDYYYYYSLLLCPCDHDDDDDDHRDYTQRATTTLR